MADTQPSNSELSAPHLSSAPICHDCGLRFDNFNTLYDHIEYYHKNHLPKWYHQPVPNTSDPNSNFHIKPDDNFKQNPNEYIDSANNFVKSEHAENFPKSNPNFAPAEPNYSKPDNQFSYEPSIKSENHEVNSCEPTNYSNTENQFSYKSVKNEHPIRENFSPHYVEPPVQSPSHNHRDFSNGFPTNGFRPKNGSERPESQIFDLDAQRVHSFQPPVPQIPHLPPPLVPKPMASKHQPHLSIPHQMEDAYDTVSTTTTSPPEPNDLSLLEQPYPKKKAGATPKSGGSWKSNEARRPKTYLCAACNKWFTSSGHLKRHYNTTLHKNAVKQTGQPDPCTLPVSAHHHPYRDPNFDASAPQRPSKTNGRASNNFVARAEGPPTPDQVPPDQQLPPHHPQPSPHMMPPSPHIMPASPHMMPPSPHNMMTLPTPPSQPQSFRDPQYSPKMSTEPAYASPSIPKDPPYVLNNNYSQDPPNLMAGPSETSEGLLPPPPPTSFYQPLMSLPTFPHQTPPPPSSIQSQNFLPLTPNYPNFQAPHVSSTQAGTNISLIGNDVLGQHVDERAFIPLLMQATRDSNTLFQLQKQYVALNFPEEYVGGLPSPQELDFSTETNPEPSGASFNDSAHVSSSSYVTYSFHPAHSSSALSPDSAFSPSCSFNNNNTDSAENLEIDVKPLNFVKSDYIIPESTTPDENSSNVISSTNSVLNSESLLSPTSLYEEKAEDPLLTSLRCDDCDKVFNKSCYLKQHNGCFHSGDKPFKCPRCGKRFMEQMQCDKHLSKHGGEKPHKCDVCPKQFHHKTDLRRHSYSHNAEKPYVCPVCGKGFIRKDHMLKHTNIHKRKANNDESYVTVVNANIYNHKLPKRSLVSQELN